MTVGVVAQDANKPVTRYSVRHPRASFSAGVGSAGCEILWKRNGDGINRDAHVRISTMRAPVTCAIARKVSANVRRMRRLIGAFWWPWSRQWRESPRIASKM